MNGPLNSDTLRAKINEASECTLEPSYLQYLREHGYSVDELLEAHAVKTDTSENAHICLKIKTYAKPMDHPDLDVATDSVVMWVCDCEDWTYRRSVDVSEETNPENADSCKHIREVSKVEKVKDDPDQSTL